jgi:hypothetical protein
MSLSKQIIFGSDADVESFIQQGIPLDLVDEYGYTPLIQAAIVNSTSKAKLLLNAGAKVDFPDLTNRTALHWAASNANLDLCKILLKKGANPNAYTSAGQPAMVVPLLKKLDKIKKILLKHGANLDFAYDFINGKLLGHRFELEGRVDIVDNTGTFIEIELEGFYLEFSLEIVLSSLVDFRNNYGAKHLRLYFKQLDIIMQALSSALELIKYQHYLINARQYQERINDLLDAEPLVLPTAYGGHAITLIKFRQWLIRCDRGAFGKKNGSVIIYDVRNRHMLNKELMQQLLYKRQYDAFINGGLIKYLGLEPKEILPLSLQKAGNCSWANVEAVVPTLMFLLLMEEKGEQNRAACRQEALDFYKEWTDWDKNRALHFCFESFIESTPARKASKAALMAAILFQYCSYDSPQDYPKAQKILSVLKQPEYSYILKSYIQVFSQDKNNPYLKNLRQFFTLFGIEGFN